MPGNSQIMHCGVFFTFPTSFTSETPQVWLFLNYQDGQVCSVDLERLLIIIKTLSNLHRVKNGRKVTRTCFIRLVRHVFLLTHMFVWLYTYYIALSIIYSFGVGSFHNTDLSRFQINCWSMSVQTTSSLC